MARFWICPKCKERCEAKNREAHEASDFCRLRQVIQTRREEGLDICSWRWRGIMQDAGVPLTRDIIRLENSGRKYKRKAVEGTWAPDWACAIMRRTQIRYPRQLRVIFLYHLLHNEELAKAVIAAIRLSNWAKVYEWLYEEIKKEVGKNAQKSMQKRKEKRT